MSTHWHEENLSRSLLQAVEDQLGNTPTSVVNVEAHSGSEDAITEVFVSETTRLLPLGDAGHISRATADRKGFMVGRAQATLHRLTRPFLACLSEVERYADTHDHKQNWALGLLVEMVILFIHAGKEFL